MAGMKAAEGPFRPGTGRFPPYLAGRRTEQRFFHSRIAARAEGVPPPSEVILFGPRGNGKTALLVWLHREIAGTAGIETVRLTPSEIETGAELAERLLPESWWADPAPDDVSVAGITWRPGRRKRLPTARDVLTARAAKKPFVLLLDEAHTLAPEVGRALLNASQIVASELPFLLVLAGTPNLRDRLSRTSASFWSRAEQIPVNRLDALAAAAAIRRPLEEEGVVINDDALDHIIGQSHGYPYFLQLWGSLVWRRAVAAGAGPPDHPRRGPGGATGIRRAPRHLLPPSASTNWRIGTSFRRRAPWPTPSRNGPPGSNRTCATSFAGAPARRPGRTTRRRRLRILRQLGFIWQSGSDPRWEPGIPSLMDYIREYAPVR